MKNVMFLFVLSILASSCMSRVNPNEWVITTTNCWNSINVQKAGQVVPRMITTCDRAIILPATDLAAELNCETKFKNKVAGSVSITYMWRIVEPDLFVKSAKSIVSSPTDTDHRVANEAIEQIENQSVDKFVIDAIRSLTPDMTAGIQELEFEKVLEEKIQDFMDSRGVDCHSFSVNINFGPQTEQALDVISAIGFYKSAGEEEFGRQVILNQAQSSKVVVNPSTTITTPAE
jgi:hypothetical protein